MTNYIVLFLFLFFISCNQTKNIEAISSDLNQSLSEPSNIQKEIDDLLAEDKKNKMLELEYLEQIRLAQENNDTEAFEFFFQEYVDVERLEIPEELKKEPNYFQGGIKVKY
ncbi:MAG: hypothetical protein CBC05_08625 [Crocinitomicaceae bacterium TMED45]|nr:MAG: hypothetical protein CBC05_08625 [Crocinitomicaceae bacterium TMED45]|tara:strand:- start:21359 stop:21691 length:333 start_codon:yes stop_codon:yes gene_type:complete